MGTPMPPCCMPRPFMKGMGPRSPMGPIVLCPGPIIGRPGMPPMTMPGRCMPPMPPGMGPGPIPGRKPPCIPGGRGTLTLVKPPGGGPPRPAMKGGRGAFRPATKPPVSEACNDLGHSDLGNSDQVVRRTTLNIQEHWMQHGKDLQTMQLCGRTPSTEDCSLLRHMQTWAVLVTDLASVTMAALPLISRLQQITTRLTTRTEAQAHQQPCILCTAGSRAYPLRLTLQASAALGSAKCTRA